MGVAFLSVTYIYKRKCGHGSKILGGATVRNISGKILMFRIFSAFSFAGEAFPASMFGCSILFIRYEVHTCYDFYFITTPSSTLNHHPSIHRQHACWCTTARKVRWRGHRPNARPARRTGPVLCWRYVCRIYVCRFLPKMADNF